MIDSLPAIRCAIREATGRTVTATPERVGGGCIHRAFRIGPFFVKINRPDCAKMFETEADGLRGMRLLGNETLLERVPSLLAGVNVRPSLLHGDLWGGNAGFLRDGTLVIYDPALYRGHHEADLAMTRLFGGFTAHFYQAHRAAFPPEPGHEERATLYNLYHILNHALLFGGGYISQAQAVVRSLI